MKNLDLKQTSDMKFKIREITERDWKLRNSLISGEKMFRNIPNTK